MFSVFRPSFGVVNEGRILNNPKDITRLNLVASGTFSEDAQGRRLEEVDVLPEIYSSLSWLQKPDNLTTFRRGKLTTSELIL
jgi:hypothetical protein